MRQLSDILLLVNQIFPFVQVGDLFYLITFLFTGPLAYQKWLFLAVFYLISIYILSSKYFFIKHESIGFVEMLIYIVCCFVIASFNFNMIKSQTLFFIKNYAQDYHKIRGNDEYLVKNKYQSVSKPLFANIKQNSNSDRILLIINESLGKATDKNIQKALLAPLYKYRQSYSSIQDGGI